MIRIFIAICVITSSVLLIGGCFKANANSTEITHIIDNDEGGNVRAYVRKALLLEAGNITVRFEGPCYSACTILLSEEFNYPKCMTPMALFGFHKPYIPGGVTEDTKEGLENLTKAMWSSYDGRIQKQLKERGWPSVTDGDRPEKITILTAFDIEGVIPFCED